MSKAMIEAILDMAREKGAKYPSFADSSDDMPVIVDTDSGRTWKLTLVEF